MSEPPKPFVAGLNRDADHARLVEALAVAREALSVVRKPGYGLQGIIEEFGHDANAYNYRAGEYWRSECYRRTNIARAALARIDALQALPRDEHAAQADEQAPEEPSAPV